MLLVAALVLAFVAAWVLYRLDAGPRLRLARAAHLYRSGDYEAALVRIGPILGHPRFGARAEYAAGACDVRLGRLDQAVAHFRAAVERGLLDAEGALGAALLGAGRAEDARRHLVSVARRGDPDAHLLLATIAEERGDPQSALLDLLIATSLDPEDPDAWAALGGLYCRLNRHERAEAALARAVQLQPTHRDALMVLAERRARCGDRPGAREAALALLTYHGADPEVRRSLGVLGLLPPGHRRD